MKRAPILLCLLLTATAAQGAVLDRSEMIARAEDYRTITLQTNTQMDTTCLRRNYERTEYFSTYCNGNPPDELHMSNIYWEQQ